MIKGSTIVRTSKHSRKEKEWKQSYSCFTEEDFLGKNIPSGLGGGFWETVNGSRISLNEANVIGNNRSTESEDYPGLRIDEVADRKPPIFILISSSINPKK